MTPGAYPCPLPGGGVANEYALSFDRGRAARLLVIPALLDEANRLRRFTVEVMRRLDAAGIDSLLPDLPGCNESRQDLSLVEPEDWATAVHAAARHFAATQVLAIRGGGLLLPPRLGGWHYAPVKGATLLKTLLRARVIAGREAGLDETVDGLLAEGVEDGLELAGYRLSGETLRQLQSLIPPERKAIATIDHATIGGAPLWLRAEPDFDPAQADALAAVVAMGVAA
ncbi:hypothetical protein B0I00_0806 [Novosphingobium kunmingense]|uniref:Exosortase A-associated hydrolase 2 n=1 Tax=Novosphingobium kunmingense TaxID=1211806 RepID=A0A2N0I333_9SPHN|nr:hypothetical protein [Novosphingobium kunmingense]PKB25604.1 hypothetical protein B0I00_0806 [Novosphingobium kunmingense]